jgi:lysophospholipase L1-like esterase
VAEKRRTISLAAIYTFALFVAGGISVARGEAGDGSVKFSFAPEKTPPGYTQVAPQDSYTTQRGFGFEPGAQLTAQEDGGPDPLSAGFITSDKPFFFSVKLPEGNYKVTLTLGDHSGESTTTVKAELRRLMLENVHTASGEVVTKTFIVNIRTPKISTGGQVKLKVPRETTSEAWAWDDRLTLEFNGKRTCLCAMDISPVQVPTVFILGDSTVCDQPAEPYCSWGQMLTRFFKPEVAVANHAESGETLSSSTGAHRLDKVLSLMKPGDYLLIQYGHNDMKSKAPDAPQAYKALLEKWIDQVKAKGGTPIVVTSMNRHSFQGDTVTNSLREYPQMARDAATEEKVPLIDLNAMSKTLYETLGPKPSIELFEHKGDDLSKFDGTHHSPYGAYELAKCIVAGIRADKIDLARYLTDDVPPFDPAHPDPVADFDVPPTPGVTGQRPLGD